MRGCLASFRARSVPGPDCEIAVLSSVKYPGNVVMRSLHFPRLTLPLLALSLAAIGPSACAGGGDADEPTADDDDDDSGSGGRSSGTDGSGADSSVGPDFSIGVAEGGAGGENPCLGPNPPEDCHLVPSKPACGDGELNQPNEVCDDGNTLPGDGCSGICMVEPNYACSADGKDCSLVFECGNGLIEPGEVCDDGNALDDDGCDATAELKLVDDFAALDCVGWFDRNDCGWNGRGRFVAVR